LSAPGVKAKEVKAQTGWKVKWGPVYAEDIPRYLANNFKRDEKMKRAKYDLKQRLDTAMGSLCPFYFLGAMGFLILGRHLLVDYLVVGAIAFVVFMSLCPWIPGERGITKAIFCDGVILAILLSIELLFDSNTHPFSIHLIIAMVMIPIYGLELGGIASTMPSDLDPFLARCGISAIGNVAFANTIRTELLNGYRELSYNQKLCKGCRSCAEVCPQGIWDIDENKRAVLAHKEACTACRACLMQCESGAIEAPLTDSMSA
jgi:NAD-dependent dihydropyrimidine dehydrogenase PreA subunit